jgi:hypothetical protein
MAVLPAVQHAGCAVRGVPSDYHFFLLGADALSCEDDTTHYCQLDPEFLWGLFGLDGFAMGRTVQPLVSGRPSPCWAICADPEFMGARDLEPRGWTR